MSKNPSVNPISHSDPINPIKPETHKSETTGTENNTVDTTGNVSRFNQVKDTITKGAGKVNEGVTKGVTTVSRGVTDFACVATKYAKENPGKAIAIAVGSGVGIGFLIGAASRRKNSFWSIVGSSVISAITDKIK